MARLMKEPITTAYAASIIGCCADYVGTLIKRGNLMADRTRKGYLLEKSDVIAFADEHNVNKAKCMTKIDRLMLYLSDIGAFTTVQTLSECTELSLTSARRILNDCVKAQLVDCHKIRKNLYFVVTKKYIIESLKNEKLRD